MASQDIALRARALVPEAGYPDSYWRSLFYFNVYRTIVAALLLITAQVFEDSVFGSRSGSLFLYASFGYIAFSGLAFLPISSHRPDFALQLGIQVVADVLFVTLLVYASSGVTSGLGLLLLASLAAAGIISRGRMTMFFAALASVAVLLEQTYEVVAHGESSTHYIQAGLLSIGYFATAWLGPYARALYPGERAARRAARGRPRQHGAGQSARDPGHEGRRARGRRAGQHPSDQSARGGNPRAVAQSRARAFAARLQSAACRSIATLA
jgi:hypothetical protein